MPNQRILMSDVGCTPIPQRDSGVPLICPVMVLVHVHAQSPAQQQCLNHADASFDFHLRVENDAGQGAGVGGISLALTGYDRPT